MYGLGADARNADASRKIYEAKGRPSDNPLIVHIAEFTDLEKIAKDIPPAAKLLSDAFWPGPLTMIVEKGELVPYETTGGMDTVAVRMPNHPVALALIREGGGYIAAPSANTSGKPSPTLAEQWRGLKRKNSDDTGWGSGGHRYRIHDRGSDRGSSHDTPAGLYHAEYAGGSNRRGPYGSRAL